MKENLFFDLLRSAVWQKEIDLTLFDNVTEQDWTEIIGLSIRQGVHALVFESVQKLPQELRPPRHLWLKWAVNVDVIEKRYDRYHSALTRLTQFFAQADIKFMVLKGLPLAQLFPVPQHRESGDLDIFMFGDGHKGDKYAVEQGLKIDHSNSKHSSFYFEGIPVENHVNFLDTHKHKVGKVLNRYLVEILEAEGVQPLALDQLTNTYFPSPTFDAIFLSRHMMCHLMDGVAVRHLCDWALFLNHNYDKIDKVLVKKAFVEAGQWNLLAIFTKLCEELLGMPAHLNFVDGSVDEVVKGKITQEILRAKKKDADGAKNAMQVLTNKFKRVNRTMYFRTLANNSTPLKEYLVGIPSTIKSPPHKPIQKK